MSQPIDIDSDGFKKVTYTKRKKQPNKVFFHSSTQFDIIDDIKPIAKNIIEDILNELRSSDFFSDFIELFLSFLEEWNQKIDYLEKSQIEDLEKPCHISLKDNEFKFDIVCYGLGNFNSCIKARYQLGFLLALKELYKVESVYIFDPLFNNNEKQLLMDFGLQVLKINENAKRKVNKKTIFFMPHCDLHLYNNVLWANWGINNLINVMIIGNSFNNYKKNFVTTTLKSDAKYVFYAEEFVNEKKLLNTFKIHNIFNDLSIHYFVFENLPQKDSDIWLQNDEPHVSMELIN